jgi:hypothetical protein
LKRRLLLFYLKVSERHWKRDIRNDLKNNPIPSEKIMHAFSHNPAAQPIHTRVASAIIGVPEKNH